MNVFCRYLFLVVFVFGLSGCWKTSYNGVKYDSYDAALVAVKQDITARLSGISKSGERTNSEIILLIPSEPELASLYSGMPADSLPYYVNFYKAWLYGCAEALKRQGYFSKVEVREGESPDFIQLSTSQRMLYRDLDSTMQTEWVMRNSCGVDEVVQQDATASNAIFEDFLNSVGVVEKKWADSEDIIVADTSSVEPFADVVKGKRYALVVGNSKYKTSPLLNPANDAGAMAAMLVSLGFEVDLKLNVDLRDFDASVERFYRKLTESKGVGLFYYAGHGLQVDGENYLVPIDASIGSRSDVRYKCLNAGRVLGKMDDADNLANIIILDACRNNPLTRSIGGGMAGFNRMDAPLGSIIAYSTAPGSVASDGNGKNGVFTKHLLKNMAVPGLDLNSIFIITRSEVVKETAGAQVPWESSSLTGKFYFRSSSIVKK